MANVVLLGLPVDDSDLDLTDKEQVAALAADYLELIEQIFNRETHDPLEALTLARNNLEATEEFSAVNLEREAFLAKLDEQTIKLRRIHLLLAGKFNNPQVWSAVIKWYKNSWSPATFAAIAWLLKGKKNEERAAELAKLVLGDMRAGKFNPYYAIALCYQIGLSAGSTAILKIVDSDIRYVDNTNARVLPLSAKGNILRMVASLGARAIDKAVLYPLLARKYSRDGFPKEKKQLAKEAIIFNYNWRQPLIAIALNQHYLGFRELVRLWQLSSALQEKYRQEVREKIIAYAEGLSERLEEDFASRLPGKKEGSYDNFAELSRSTNTSSSQPPSVSFAQAALIFIENVLADERISLTEEVLGQIDSGVKQYFINHKQQSLRKCAKPIVGTIKDDYLPQLEIDNLTAEIVELSAGSSTPTLAGVLTIIARDGEEIAAENSDDPQQIKARQRELANWIEESLAHKALPENIVQVFLALPPWLTESEAYKPKLSRLKAIALKRTSAPLIP